jgi:MEMO1 family protein
MAAMTIRPPAVSGTFYPSDPTILSLQIDRMLDEHADALVNGRVLALISPHAGYAYSGATAAAAYALLRGRAIRRAVIVAPSHREYFNGMSIYDGDAYRTPLGLVEVDHELREMLLAHRGVFVSSQFGHREEHAIEVQLPFLQRVLDDITFVPIVMGDQRSEHCMLLGEVLADVLSHDDTVLIASSDLSHMLPDGEAKRTDRVVADDIRALAPGRLLEDLAHHRTEACGGGPIVAVLHASTKQGATCATILDQCTSGDVTGVHHSVVGYLSAAITRAADA